MKDIDGLIISKIISGNTSTSKAPYVLDVFLDKLTTLKSYSSVDCDLGFYPYNRGITSDDFKFLPYEEYVNDVSDGLRSIYSEEISSADKIFGVVLALVIVGIFIAFKPEEIYSLQSVVTAFGAYAIGKEIWNDLSQTLVNLTKRLPVKFKDRKHYYSLENPDTLARYFKFARSKRYQTDTTHPDRIDLISQSNSKEVELRFFKNNLKDINSETLHLLTIQFDPRISKLLSTGYFMIVGLSLNSSILFISREEEIFQSVENGKVGIQNEKGEWFENSYLTRTSYSIFGRIKLYGRSKIIAEKQIISAQKI